MHFDINIDVNSSCMFSLDDLPIEFALQSCYKYFAGVQALFK